MAGGAAAGVVRPQRCSLSQGSSTRSRLCSLAVSMSMVIQTRGLKVGVASLLFHDFMSSTLMGGGAAIARMGVTDERIDSAPAPSGRPARRHHDSLVLSSRCESKGSGQVHATTPSTFLDIA